MIKARISRKALYAAADFAGMRVASQSPFFDEGSSWWEDGVYLSDRLDIPNDHFYRSYRLVVTDFTSPPTPAKSWLKRSR